MGVVSSFPCGIYCTAFDDTEFEIKPDRVSLYLAFIWAKAESAIPAIAEVVDRDGALEIWFKAPLSVAERDVLNSHWVTFGGHTVTFEEMTRARRARFQPENDDELNILLSSPEFHARYL